MAVRKIIEIDEDKCTGCGLCIPGCAEGALQIVDGKARLVKDIYCDGLGACLGECPEDALKIVERDADGFDEEAAMEHVKETGGEPQEKAEAKEAPSFGCPSSQAMSFSRKEAAPESAGELPSELTHWPVKIDLVNPRAPFLKDADLLIAADCAPFAYASFHDKLIRGHALIIGCPKLNDPDAYLRKITDIIKENDLKSVTVVHMEVPCCFGLNHIVDKAIMLSGKNVEKKTIVVGVKGDITEKN